MLPATRALSRQGTAGQCLPDVIEPLGRAGAHFRRSQMSMLVAAPNVGKSAFATIYAAMAGVRTLYFSADTDPHTMTCRLAASLTGATQDTVDEALGVGRGENFIEAVDRLTNLQFCYDGSPSIEDILDEVDAYAMVYGEYPELIIVDNLMDVYADGEEHAGMKAILDELHELARTTGAHVMVLHHATGEYENGNEPIPLKGISNKLAKKPELVISLYRITDAWTDALGVCVIKNRNGKADRSAGTTIWLQIDLARMALVAPTPQPPIQVTDHWSPSRYADD